MEIHILLLLTLIILVISSFNLYKEYKKDKKDKSMDKKDNFDITKDLWICSYPRDPSIISIKFNGNSFDANTKSKKIMSGIYDENALYTIPDKKDVFTPYKYVPNDDSLIILTLGSKNEVHIFNRESEMRNNISTSQNSTYRGYYNQNYKAACIQSLEKCTNFECNEKQDSCFCMYGCLDEKGNKTNFRFATDCSPNMDYIGSANSTCKTIFNGTPYAL